MPVIERICVGCRKPQPIEKLVRLTVDPVNSMVVLNEPGVRKTIINGRSAYICRCEQCVNIAIKTMRLKFALNGRQVKPELSKRRIIWPLESQLIKDILRICTEPGKTCQNTKNKEA